MKRKLLALFLVLSMCVGIFAGCSNGGSGSSSSSAGGDSSTADTSSEAGSEASTGDTAGKQTDGKNLPELTTEPLDILFWDISTEDPSKTMSESAVARFMETIFYKGIMPSEKVLDLPVDCNTLAGSVNL